MIFAIDPGPVSSAWCILGENGTPMASEIESNEALLGYVKCHSAAGYKIVIEMIASYGMPVGREVFETCVWIGRFTEAAKGSVNRVYRQDVKLHICKSPKANDSTIRQALIDRFGPPGTKKNPGVTYGFSKDKWAALAVAVTAYDRGLRT